MESLLALLHSIYPMTDALRSHLMDILQSKNFSKRDFLLEVGNTSKCVYFIESGLVRCFYTKERGEVSSWFMKEGDVIISVQSFFLQKISRESIQALEDTFVYYITWEQLQFIQRHFMEFNFISRALTEKYYILCEQRLEGLQMQSAPERYKYLFDNHLELIKRVPSKHLASYLDISRETFSRIRNNFKPKKPSR
jgi:CRP/FNR family transcriptional regulator, anaerobic regulatory protein